jgi:hypothetical protein
MDRKKQNLLEMRKLGFSTQTISLLSESQIKMILEKIKNKKKEAKEAQVTTTTTKKYGKDEPLNMTPSQLAQVEPKKNTDGSIEITTTKTETTEGKKKKYNPWAVCTASVGRKNKKKYEDCVMGVKKKLKEGKNPYEYIIESKIEEIVENNLSPKLSKSEILSIIAEKKMIKKETMEANTETAPVKAPPKTNPDTRPSHPGRKDKEQPNPRPRAGTETAPVKAPPKPNTKPDTRPSHPGRKDKEQPNPRPRASSSEMESKKSEIITAIFNLIDKENK